MGLGKKEGFVGKGIQILEVIINHNIAGNDFFGTTENYLLPGNKREVLVQPFILFLLMVTYLFDPHLHLHPSLLTIGLIGLFL